MIRQIQDDLSYLCNVIGERHPGSWANKSATKYLQKRLEKNNFEIEKQKFSCIDWKNGKIKLFIGEIKVEASVCPYSLPCKIKGKFSIVETIEKLEKISCEGKILVLHGALTKEQLMPKNFIFYNPQEHKRIVALLEEKKPAVILAITKRNPQLTGGVYPFPLIEDGDFDIPCAYMTDWEGKKLFQNPNSEIFIEIDSQRIPSNGYNIIGRKIGKSKKKVVVCAHIDTKKDTIGALDNGASVCTLLALSDLLKDTTPDIEVEIFFPNGEDYYAASGEMLYLAKCKKDFPNILLAVNLDGAACKNHKTAFSIFGCEPSLKKRVFKVFEDKTKYVEIANWYQSDHMIFVQNGVPSVALTSENYQYLFSNITHTHKDRPSLVDNNTILDIATKLKDLILSSKVN